jgi:hypothetical protein
MEDIIALLSPFVLLILVWHAVDLWAAWRDYRQQVRNGRD